MSLKTRLDTLVATIAASIKAHAVLINGNVPTLAALTTTDKSNLVSAINEINAKPTNSLAIDDATTSTTKVWSSSKTNTAISSAVAAVVNSASSTLDTLGEIAAALGNDANFATTILTALGFRVRYDAAQSLTAGQKIQALANIGAASDLEIGWTETDLAAAFSAALI